MDQQMHTRYVWWWWWGSIINIFSNSFVRFVITSCYAWFLSTCVWFLQMSLVFCPSGLVDVRPPSVAQSFLNHNARLFKLFVIKDKYFVVERPSLKNFQAGGGYISWDIIGIQTNIWFQQTIRLCTSMPILFPNRTRPLLWLSWMM